MALLHIEFDIDSDVQPELHAALTLIGSPASQGERLRQLAFAGLLWEKVRIHGSAMVEMALTAPQDAREPREPQMFALDAAGAWSEPEPAPMTPLMPLAPTDPPALPALLPTGLAGGDFIDLAIDAPEAEFGTGPAPEPADEPAPEPEPEPAFRAASGQAPIPALVPAPAPAPPSVAWPPVLRPLPSTLPVAAPPSSERELPVLLDVVELGVTYDGTARLSMLAPASGLVAGGTHRPAGNTRLRRMKEKGLFKNG